MIKRILGVAGAAVGTVALVAAPAAASSHITMYDGSGRQVANGSFSSVSERFAACDDYPDGYGVRVDWYVPATGRRESFSNTNGAGTCTIRDYNIGEGNRVEWRLCLVNNGSTVRCQPTAGSGYLTDYA